MTFKQRFTRIFVATLVGFCGLMILLVVIAVNSDTKIEPVDNVPVAKNPDMNLEVRYSLTEKGFTVPVLTVKNLNDFKWEECVVTINDKYTKSISPILRPKDFESFGGLGYHTMASVWFTAKDGSIFNPSTTRPVSVFVKCNKPYSGYGVYSFKN